MSLKLRGDLTCDECGIWHSVPVNVDLDSLNQPSLKFDIPADWFKEVIGGYGHPEKTAIHCARCRPKWLKRMMP